MDGRMNLDLLNDYQIFRAFFGTDVFKNSTDRSGKINVATEIGEKVKWDGRCFLPLRKMNKTKLDERIENALNAFFETPPDHGQFALRYTGQTALAATETSFSEKADKWSRIVREIFMFGPGTLCLFCGTLTSVFFYGAVGRSFGFEWIFTYLLFVFLTYAGSGSIKNYKNLAVPGIVITMSLAIAIVPSFLLGKELADQYFWHSMYLFPFVLVCAKLVQSWVSDD